MYGFAQVLAADTGCKLVEEGIDLDALNQVLIDGEPSEESPTSGRLHVDFSLGCVAVVGYARNLADLEGRLRDAVHSMNTPKTSHEHPQVTGPGVHTMNT